MLRNLSLFKNPLAKLNFNSWFRIAKADNAPAILSRRHIYILPTRFGVIFVILLLSMLLGSMNYSLSLGFALTFLLAGIGHAAMLHTWRNIAYLQIKLHHMHATFAGEPLQIELTISETRGRDRTGVLLHFECEPPLGYSQVVDILAFKESNIKLSHSTNLRGRLNPARIKIYSEFPLTLFHAWAYVQLDVNAIIYPMPSLLEHIANLSQDTVIDHLSNNVTNRQVGIEDFAGHKSYRIGDNLKKVNWKASSKLVDSEIGIPNLLVKEFEGLSANNLVFDWVMTAGLAHEARISLLTRWIIDATEVNQVFSLKIPQLEITKNSGSDHMHVCLNALALMP